MDRDTELTAYLLRYLCENQQFKSMEHVADTLGISKRHVQRIINNADSLKGGSIALNKILQYFALHQIPLDPVLKAFNGTRSGQEELKGAPNPIPYYRLGLPKPECTDAQVIKAFEYYKEFVGLVSVCICPSCPTWCNPWDGSDKLKKKNCFVAEIANVLIGSLENTNDKNND